MEIGKETHNRLVKTQLIIQKQQQEVIHFRMILLIHSQAIKTHKAMTVNQPKVIVPKLFKMVPHIRIRTILRMR